MRSSLRTIAEKAGVSVNTVSKILNRGREDLYRKETVEHVRRIAEEAGYRRNLAARMLLTNSSRMIAFVTLSLENKGTVRNAVVYPFLVGATDFLAEHDYHVVLVPIKELLSGSTAMPQVLKEHFFDGLILQLGPWERIRAWKDASDTPTLHWDSGVFEAVNCLYRDEIEVGRELTRKLIALGHRRIAFAMTPADWQGYRLRKEGSGAESLDFTHFSISQRYDGYREAMDAARLAPVNLETGTAVTLADNLLAADPTAVVVHGGPTFGPFEMAARRLGWPIPERLSVAACDVDPGVQLKDAVRLGGFFYDRYETGRQAGEMLLAMLKSKSRQTPSRVLHGEFHLGETIIRPPASGRS